VDRSVPGVLSVDMARLSALESGQGSLLELDFHVRDGVAAGSYRLDLQWASLNDGRLTLNPAPKAGIDVTDGSIQVQQRLTAPTAPKEFLLTANAMQATTPSVARPAAQLVIDWSADARKTEIPSVRVSAQEPQRKWSLEFVDSLGKSADELNPNQRIKLKLPTVVSATKPLG